MKKIIFTFMLLLSCESLLSQECPNYFPLAVGNKWDYSICVGECWLTGAMYPVCISITRDTLMDNGKRYFIIENDSINILGYYMGIRYYENPLFNWKYPIRMDEKGDVYQYDTLTKQEYLYYRFSELGSYNSCDRDFTAQKGGYGAYENHKDAISINYDWDSYYSHSYIAVFKNGVGLLGIHDVLTSWRLEFSIRRAIIDGKYIENPRAMDIKPIAIVPEEITLHQNYPNPFNPETRIDFEIPKTDKVKLVIYNTLGKKVKTLLDGELQAGKYSTTWNGKDDINNKVSSGIYFYQLTFGNNVQSITKKLIILK
jgi:hypothetical protein